MIIINFIKINKVDKKRGIIYTLTLALSIAYIFFGNKIATENPTNADVIDEYGCQKAVVTNIIKRTSSLIETQGSGAQDDIIIILEAKVKTGKLKGETVTVMQSTSPHSAMQIKEVEKGDKVLIFENLDLESDIDWFVGEYVRTDALINLTLVLVFLLLLFGHSKGINTIISLAFTCLAIFLVFIPSVLSGLNIYFWAILTCVFTIVMTLLIINGANKKSFCAGIGCISGVLLTGGLTVYMDKVMILTGLVDDEAMYLMFVNPKHPIDLRAIIFAAITIGAMGAIMDVAMSIASALLEIKNTSENPTFSSLIKSGFTIGRDIMGTMANTLVLAYIGGSLSVTLLLMAYNTSTLHLMNREMIVVEVLQALVGSFGILFAIPFTTLVCAILYTKEKGVNYEKNSCNL